MKLSKRESRSAPLADISISLAAKIIENVNLVNELIERIGYKSRSFNVLQVSCNKYTYFSNIPLIFPKSPCTPYTNHPNHRIIFFCGGIFEYSSDRIACKTNIFNSIKIS